MSVSALDSREQRLLFLELLTYLATSARGVIYEPRLYGPLRLMEAAQRLIRLMVHLGVADTELEAIAERIVVEAMAIATDDERCISLTDEATLLFARKLREI